MTLTCAKCGYEITTRKAFDAAVKRRVIVYRHCCWWHLSCGDPEREFPCEAKMMRSTLLTGEE